MNLIEAIKSGKPFRRKGQTVQTPTGFFSPMGDECTLSFFRDSIVAEDWEVEEPVVTITRTQFWAACEAVALACGKAKDFDQAELARCLGLEDG